jgi:hypothetical protein
MENRPVTNDAVFTDNEHGLHQKNAGEIIFEPAIGHI